MLKKKDAQIRDMEIRIQEILQSEGEMISIHELRRREREMQIEIQHGLSEITRLQDQLLRMSNV